MITVTIFEKVGTAECVCPKFCHIPLLCLGVKRIQQVSIAFHYTQVSCAFPHSSAHTHTHPHPPTHTHASLLLFASADWILGLPPLPTSDLEIDCSLHQLWNLIWSGKNVCLEQLSSMFQPRRWAGCWIACLQPRAGAAVGCVEEDTNQRKGCVWGDGKGRGMKKEDGEMGIQ